MSSDGRKSERNCGDQTTQFSRRESENTGCLKRKVSSSVTAWKVKYLDVSLGFVSGYDFDVNPFL